MYDVELINGDLPEVTTMITSWRLTIQRVKIRLFTFLGEWALDVGEGLPYVAWNQTRGLDPSLVAARIKLEIQETPGVIRVSECVALLNTSTRVLSVRAKFFVEDEDLAPLGVSLGFDLGPDANSSPYFTISILSSVGIVP